MKQISMKTLLIVRHAKSDWKDENLIDFERPLNSRGKKNAPEMGLRMKRHGFKPDLIWSSAAQRAQRTAKLIAKAIKYPEKAIVFDEALYHASHRSLIEQIQQQDNKHEFIMLVGHNPGVSMLASALGNITIDNMPTTAMALINFELETWSEVAMGTGSLLWYDYPKSKNNF